MTKVTSIQVSHPVSRAVYSWVGNTEEHHDLSHATDAEPDRIAEYLLAERWSTEQFRYVLERLKATPSPDGPGTLFDDTLVLWAQEVGDSRSHESISVPFVLSGLGRRISHGSLPSVRPRAPQPSLVSICRAFGMDLDTFGDQRRGRWLGRAGLMVRLFTFGTCLFMLLLVGCGQDGDADTPVHSGPEDAGIGADTRLMMPLPNRLTAERVAAMVRVGKAVPVVPGARALQMMSFLPTSPGPVCWKLNVRGVTRSVGWPSTRGCVLSLWRLRARLLQIWLP